MPKAPNPLVKKARKLYGDGMPLVEIAKRLKVPPGSVRRWKSEGKLDSERSDTEQKASAKKPNVQKKPRGGQPGNKNAVGNGGGAPPGSQNHLKHGFYSRLIPVEYLKELEERGEITEEQRLKIQLDFLELRQMRLMDAERENAASKNGLALEKVTRSGNETSTTAVSTFERMLKLEALLTAAQRAHIRGVEILHKVQQTEDKSNDMADDWIAAMSEVDQGDED